MFSIQKFFGKEDKFFGLLEASAQEAQACVKVLSKMTRENRGGLLAPFVESRTNGKRIREQISEELVSTFVTILEREDIESLSAALYKLPKAIEKFAEHFMLVNPKLRDVDFSPQIVLLEQAMDLVLEMVKKLRKISDLEEVSELNNKLQLVEGQADKLMLDLLRDLYNGKHDPLMVLVLKDLYELLEKVIDRCRDVGNLVSHVVMKNS